MAFIAQNYQQAVDFTASIQDNGWHWESRPLSGPTVINVHVTDYDGGYDAVRSWERSAFWEALKAWEKIADIDFRPSRSARGADIVLMTGRTETFPGDYPEGILAAQDGPFTAYYYDTPAYGIYFRDNPSWTVAGLKPGGDGFTLLLHELGHAIGLSHTFDKGSSGSSRIGLPASQVSELVTAMAYADWRFAEDGFARFRSVADLGATKRVEYGHLLTPGPLDMAAVQMLYGGNHDRDDGNGDGDPDDTYWLPSRNEPGTGWTTIWDTGGVDWIRYGGSRPTRITLETFEPMDLLGQDVTSQARWIRGGLIIADDYQATEDIHVVEGALIENASGGRGNDRIVGNDAANELRGNAGADWIHGGGRGEDLLFGGAGDDRLRGGMHDDRLRGDGGNDTLDAGTGDDLLFGGEGRDILRGRRGVDVLVGEAGDDTLTGGAYGDRFVFRAGDGRDEITDFNRRGDLIDLRWHADVRSHAQVVEAAREGEHGVSLRLGEDRVYLAGVELADLSGHVFLI